MPLLTYLFRVLLKTYSTIRRVWDFKYRVMWFVQAYWWTVFLLRLISRMWLGPKIVLHIHHFEQFNYFFIFSLDTKDYFFEFRFLRYWQHREPFCFYKMPAVIDKKKIFFYFGRNCLTSTAKTILIFQNSFSHKKIYF